MVYVWRTQHGTWGLRPTDQGAWDLCWYDAAGQFMEAAAYTESSGATSAIWDHTTGIRAWDRLIGHPARIRHLGCWERRDSFPD
jgi:hypothetical protein